MKGPEPLGSSFRDPSGFVFRHDGAIYRQVNQRYRPAYDHLRASGLAAQLEARGQLLPFEEADPALARSDDAYKILRPQPLPFVSHPYEWCPSQLRDAALLTLRVQQAALDHGMTLKDASAYNVQFVGARPVFIDHLSFDLYEAGAPWQGYRQFCQHFLAPLALACLVDVRLTQLLRVHLDGIPLDLAARLLPWRSHLRLSLLAHVHLHMRSQARYRGAGAATPRRAISPAQLRALVRHLETAIQGLAVAPAGHRVGGLLCRDQLHGRRAPRQAAPRGGVSRPRGAADRLGPRRQRRAHEPAGLRSRHPDRVLRRRSGRGGAELCAGPCRGRSGAPAALARPDQPEPGAGLGQPGAGLPGRAGPGGPGDGPRPGPPSRHLEQPAVRSPRRGPGAPGPLAPRGVRPEGGLAGRAPSRHAGGHLRSLRSGTLRGRVRPPLRDPRAGPDRGLPAHPLPDAEPSPPGRRDGPPADRP